ncbi:MAG: polyphosphate polymerase domain-containing protein [Sphingobacteriaceae bacterium]|nr:polyphosphate polymerase domain-containing protein [Sphingobacteriaceae bacterium]MBK7818629.1 polyphosphate polymerase domain-containing protein [Sphingobacteriaceae bacterium]
MSQIITILNTFDTITLGEMDKVKLMDRMDSKYMFAMQTLPAILENCRAHYFVTDISGNKYSSYETLYYDTNDYRLYTQHHAGKLNRYKIRKRTYVESALTFLEVKFKDNKGRTTKDRIKLKGNDIDANAIAFIEKETPLKAKDLKPSVQINYTRITLVSKALTERITIDLNLTIGKNDLKRTFTNVVIAEVKQNKTNHSEFTHLMREHRIKQGAMSKYCFGISNLVEEVKKNNFKEKNTRILKLNHL